MLKKIGAAIDCDKSFGPNFGNCDIYLKENMKIGGSYATDYSNFLCNNNLELTGGNGESENFETEELEVYQVIY